MLAIVASWGSDIFQKKRKKSYQEERTLTVAE
jgi:hypothetical protein